MSCIRDNSKNYTDPNPVIFEVLNNQTTAWNRADIKGFMDGYEKSDSLQFITRKGRTLGWQSVYDNYVKHYPTKKEMGELHFKNLIIKNLSDSLAQVYGNWELMKDSAVGGNFSLIMKNKPEGWKIVIDHTW
ncbi:MAG: DUF4440 domain-containing protein [Bacteroidia bacterium]